MTISFSHKAIGHLVEPATDSDTWMKVSPQVFESFVRPGGNVYALIRGPINREVVKIDVSASINEMLKVARGQGGTTANAWPLGALLFNSTNEDHYNSIIQLGESRIIDYNPNEILAPLYAGEKVYQNAPAGCERWWISFNGTDPYWDIFTGAPCGNEAYTDIGGDYDILISSSSWDGSHFDNTNWDIRFENYGIWVPGSPGYWDSIVNSSYHRVYLTELGAWNIGYEPSKVRLTVGGNPASLEFLMRFGGFMRSFSTGYDSLVELDINPAYYNDGPLNVIHLYDYQTDPFTIEAIEFYV